MSLPYMPGWGDTLAQHLPKLGQDIAKITNPYREEETMFKQLIATKPELMDEYIQKEQDSPGSLKGIFGQKVSDFVRQQPISEGYRVQREREKSALEGSKLGNKAAEIGISQKTLEYIQDKDLWEFTKNNPNVEEAWRYGKTTGTTGAQDLENRMRVASDIRERSNLAKPFQGKSGTELAYMYKDGKIGADVMQGIIENNPGAMGAAFAILDDESRAKLQRELQKLSNQGNDRYFRNLLWKEAGDMSQKLGINNPNDYARIFYGKNLEGYPESTPESLSQAQGRMDFFRNQEIQKVDEVRRKENLSIFSGIQGNIKSLSGQASMGMDDYQRSAIESSINSGLLELSKNLGPNTEYPPQFKRVPGTLWGNNGAWYMGNKKISESDFSAYMDRLVKNIAVGQTPKDPGEGQPPAAPASPTLPPPPSAINTAPAPTPPPVRRDSTVRVPPPLPAVRTDTTSGTRPKTFMDRVGGGKSRTRANPY